MPGSSMQLRGMSRLKDCTKPIGVDRSSCDNREVWLRIRMPKLQCMIFFVPFHSIFSGSSTESSSYNGNVDPEVSGGLVVNNEESNMSDRSHEITEICIHETLI